MMEIYNAIVEAINNGKSYEEIRTLYDIAED